MRRTPVSWPWYPSPFAYGVGRLADEVVVTHPPQATIDLFEPEQQGFPSTQAALTAAGFPTASAGWLFDEGGAATTLADFTGNGQTLTLEPLENGRSIPGQPAVGFYDGAAWDGKRALEWLPGADVVNNWSLADANVFDLDETDSIAFVVVFRCAEPPPDGENRYLLQKGSVSLLAAAGYDVGVGTKLGDGNGNVGTPFFLIRDQDILQNSAFIKQHNHCDGAWHVLLAKLDRTAQEISIQSDMRSALVEEETFNPTDLNGTLSNTLDAFSVGAPAIDAAGNPTDPIRGQLAYLLVFTGANAESLTWATVDAWWRHGKVGSSDLTSYKRARTVHVVVNRDAGEQVAAWGKDQVAYEHDPRTSTNPACLGLACHPATTNILRVTDLGSSEWTPTLVTRTENAADSPRCLREATRLTDLGDGGLLSGLYPLVAGQVVTLSCWVAWDGTGTAPNVRLVDDLFAIEAQANATETDGEFYRLQVTWTVDVSGDYRVILQPNAPGQDGGTADFWGPQLEYAASAGPWVATHGDPESSAAPVALVTVTGADNDDGTIKIWATPRAQDGGSTNVPWFQDASFVAPHGPTETGTGPITVDWPADHQAGDVALLIVETANQGVNLSTPSGFALMPDSPQGTGVPGGAASVGLTVFWARATSSAMAAVVVADSGDHQFAQILTFRGCVETGNPWDVTAGNVAAIPTTAVSIPGDTTTVDDCLIVAIVANATDTAAPQGSDWANDDLAGIDEVTDQQTSFSGNGGGFTVIVGGKPVAGAYGATAGTLATASVQARMSIALKGPAGATAQRTLAALTTGAASANHTRASAITEAEEPTTVMLDATGANPVTATAAAAANLATVETIQVSWWDRGEADGYSAKVRRGAATAQTNTDMPATSAVVETLHVGADGFGRLALGGSVSRIVLWDSVTETV